MNIEKLETDIWLLCKCIEHWEKDNVGCTKPIQLRITEKYCALCKKYTTCIGCPISDDNEGDYGCGGTPWYRIKGLKDTWIVSNEKPRHLERTVQEMIAYLKKLKAKLEAQLELAIFLKAALKLQLEEYQYYLDTTHKIFRK